MMGTTRLKLQILSLQLVRGDNASYFNETELQRIYQPAHLSDLTTASHNTADSQRENKKQRLNSNKKSESKCMSEHRYPLKGNQCDHHVLDAVSWSSSSSVLVSDDEDELEELYNFHFDELVEDEDEDEDKEPVDEELDEELSDDEELNDELSDDDDEELL